MNFFPVTIFHFLPKRIIFIHQNMVIFQVMICKTTSTTPSHLYHHSNQKSSHIDSVRRITTIRELNQNNFNYNQFYNKNNYHFTSKFNHIFINDLQNQIKHTLSPLSIIKSKIIPHRQCEAYYNYQRNDSIQFQLQSIFYKK